MLKTPWTDEDIFALIIIHEDILRHWNYPDEVKLELRRARDKWLLGVPRAKKAP